MYFLVEGKTDRGRCLLQECLLISPKAKMGHTIVPQEKKLQFVSTSQQPGSATFQIEHVFAKK